jgi:hypothetical protein
MTGRAIVPFRLRGPISATASPGHLFSIFFAAYPRPDETTVRNASNSGKSSRLIYSHDFRTSRYS